MYCKTCLIWYIMYHGTFVLNHWLSQVGENSKNFQHVNTLSFSLEQPKSADGFLGCRVQLSWMWLHFREKRIYSREWMVLQCGGNPVCLQTKIKRYSYPKQSCLIHKKYMCHLNQVWCRLRSVKIGAPVDSRGLGLENLNSNCHNFTHQHFTWLTKLWQSIWNFLKSVRFISKLVSHLLLPD